jgi:hypothetical protein
VFQDADEGAADLGEECVGEAGDEEGDAQDDVSSCLQTHVRFAAGETTGHSDKSLKPKARRQKRAEGWAVLTEAAGMSAEGGGATLSAEGGGPTRNWVCCEGAGGGIGCGGAGRGEDRGTV